MRKAIFLLIACLLLLACFGCDAILAPDILAEETPAPRADATETAAASATPEPTPSPTPEPVFEAAILEGNGVGVLVVRFEKGQVVQVTGEDGDYYTILTEEADGVALLIEKRLVRLASDALFEAWAGYARKNTAVYANVYLEGEPIATLALNTKVQVTEDFTDVLEIEWDGQTGYAASAQISRKKISTGGGGGGSSGGGGDGGGGSSGGSDGGDIILSAPSLAENPFVRMVRRAGTDAPFTPGEGRVAAQDAEAYLALLSRGEELKVTEQNAEYCEILLDGNVGRLPKSLVRLASEAEYAAWDGYAKRNAPFYAGYRRIDAPVKLKVNTIVRVLFDTGDGYVVEVDGQIGYMAKDQVSEKKISTSSGGGGSSGGSGGGGSSGGDWTDPVL